jgi:hypothetical protein
MGVVKYNQSKKAVHFVTDEGVIYQTSTEFLLKFLDGKMNGEFMVLTRLAFGASPGRFPKSKVYPPDAVVKEGETTGTDSYSDKARHEAKLKKQYSDEVLL